MSNLPASARREARYGAASPELVAVRAATSGGGQRPISKGLPTANYQINSQTKIPSCPAPLILGLGVDLVVGSWESLGSWSLEIGSFQRFSSITCFNSGGIGGIGTRDTAMLPSASRRTVTLKVA